MRYFFYIPWLLSVWPLAAQDSLKTYRFDETVITATRSKIYALEAPNSMQVITRETLEQAHVQMLQDALKSVAGIEFKDYGGISSVKLLSMRGSTGEQVLVLRDGVKLNNPAYGLADLSLINLEDVERIEVYRGGASALYGADAVGGVINIITKGSKTAQNFSAQSEAAISTFDQRTWRMSLRFPLAGWNTSLIYRREYQPDSSYKVNDPISDKKVYRVNSSTNSHAWWMSVRRLTPKWDIVLNHHWLWRDIEFPSTIFNNTSALSGETQGDRQISINPQASYQATDQWLIRGSASYFFTRLNYSNVEPVLNSYTKTYTWSGELIQEFQFNAAHKFTGGLVGTFSGAKGFSEERSGSVTNTSGFETPDVNHQGAFAGDEVRWNPGMKWLDQILIFPSIRVDHYSLYGTAWSPKIGVNGLKRDGKRYYAIRASAGKNFRAPTFNERFWRGDGAIGNASIKPERSVSIDAGITYGAESDIGSLQLDFNVFRIRTRDQIVWLVSNPVTPINQAKTLSQGYEIIAAYAFQNFWKSEFNYTKNRAIDQSEPDQDYRARYQPLYSFKMSHSLSFRQWTTTATTRYVSERFANLQNTLVLKPYWITDAGVGYSFRIKRIKTTLRMDVKNVFDAYFEPVSLFPTVSREFLFSVAVTY
ncbi:TonB-dependent receptor plug domain-containing protein [bacterium]|nr:TonB-dependent receptor plug domain-containing protein [bacterium]